MPDISESRAPGPIMTNDPKDGIIARLIERSEWMMDEAKLNRRVIERLDETLDHISVAVTKQTSAVEALSKTVSEQESLKKAVGQLREQLAVMGPQVEFWNKVKDRIFWIGVAVILAAFAAGWAGTKMPGL